MIRTVKTYSLRNFLIYNTVLTIVTILYITSPWLFNFIAEGLYLLILCSYFAHHTLLSWATRNVFFVYMNSFLFVFLLLLLLLLSCFSHVRLCETPETAAHQAPPSLGFSRQEHWSGLPFPSPMHEREK